MFGTLLVYETRNIKLKQVNDLRFVAMSMGNVLVSKNSNNINIDNNNIFISSKDINNNKMFYVKNFLPNINY